MKKILTTSVAAACLIGCSALTAPAASAYAPPRHPVRVLKAKACPPGHYCLSPIEVGHPRPRTP